MDSVQKSFCINSSRSRINVTFSINHFRRPLRFCSKGFVLLELMWQDFFALLELIWQFFSTGTYLCTYTCRWRDLFVLLEFTCVCTYVGGKVYLFVLLEYTYLAKFTYLSYWNVHRYMATFICSTGMHVVRFANVWKLKLLYKKIHWAKNMHILKMLFPKFETILLIRTNAFVEKPSRPLYIDGVKFSEIANSIETIFGWKKPTNLAERYSLCG
jgi:hypothetical protein